MHVDFDLDPADTALPLRHRSAATPLAWAYAGLIAYASLYPFAGWRSQGVDPLAFLFAPWPHYWTGFDVAANLLGYGPLGFLLALGELRSGRPAPRAALLAAGVGLALSLALETLQIYLPLRVASNLDLALNGGGAALGALAALLLDRSGLLRHWSRLRGAWVASGARGALVLLALWPWALVYPVAVPFGLGQAWERAAQWLAEALQRTPFEYWLPLPQSAAAAVVPLSPLPEAVCVALGLLAPSLLAFSVIGAPRKRAVALLLLTAAGLAATALSAALSWGPAVAWVWLTPPVQAGAALALLLAAVAAPRLPPRGCALLAVPALALSLILLNRAPTSIWFAQTLQVWEQGRFIRFHGVAQWLNWFWPHLALLYLLVRLARPAPGEP